MNAQRLPTVVIENVTPRRGRQPSPAQTRGGRGTRRGSRHLQGRPRHHRGGAEMAAGRDAKNPWQRDADAVHRQNDRWRASNAASTGRSDRHEFTVEAWQDTFATLAARVRQKIPGGRSPNSTTEVEEGAQILLERAAVPRQEVCQVDSARLTRTRRRHPRWHRPPTWIASRTIRSSTFSWKRTCDRECLHGDAALRFPVYVDRDRLPVSPRGTSSFPRSRRRQTRQRPSTFRDCLGRVDDAARRWVLT